MVLRTLSGRLRPTQARRCSLRSGPSGRHIKDAPPASDAPTACRRATTGAENKPERRLLSCGWSEERKARSEEHTSELQSLMRISYAVFCLQKKKKKTIQHNQTQN